MVCIGIIEFYTPDLTNIAIETASKNAGMDHHMIVVINSPKTAKEIKKFAGQLIMNRRNVGFSKASNQIIKTAGKHDVVLLNSDTRCEKDWLKELNNAAYTDTDKKIGMACPRLIEKFGLHTKALCAHKGSECLKSPGPIWFFKGWHGFACTYIRRDMIDEIGILQEKGFFNYGSDKEYGLRAAKYGYWTAHTHQSVVLHIVKGSQVKTRTW